ncbi:hypothetical protein ACLB2K_050427 [Fragaria x ananassa]
MRGLAAKDPHFIYRFTIDPEDRLVDIFWRDGHSYVDYQCYGDVVIFDSTYKTNAYNQPLVLFVGTNNHRGSIVFGAALISDETVETYTWLLRIFLESMNGKMPKAVLTDSDVAMRQAIETMMPKARHRLCIWHIAKNATSHLKTEKKLKASNRCMRKYQTIEQFETLWQEMLDEFDLHDNIWIQNMYEKRDKFCQAFFGDIFMAGMRSTQRCEGMNKDCKKVLGKGKTLVEVVSLIYRFLMKLRNNQERDEFMNMNSFPCVKTHLKDLEKQAFSVFTHDVLKWIVKEMKTESFVTLKQGVESLEDGSRVYKVLTYKRPDFEHTVVYCPEKETDIASDPIMVCSCRMFEFRGVPCRHMFSVMKNKHVVELHKSLIMKRWSKDARSVCDIPYPVQSMPKEALEVSRTKGREKLDKKTEPPRRPITCGYCQGTGRNSQTCEVRKEKEMADKSNKNDERNTDAHPSVSTPAKRSCGYCKQSGHYTQTCDVRKEKENAEKTEENVAGRNTDPPSVATPAKRTIHCGECGEAGHTYRKCQNKNRKWMPSDTSEE